MVIKADSTVTSLETLLETEYREPIKYCGDWLTNHSLTMIHAKPGVGKTWFSLGLAHALAYQENFLAWPIHNNCKVLYLDWEMGKPAIKKRMERIKRGYQKFCDNRMLLGPNCYSTNMIGFVSNDKLIVDNKLCDLGNKSHRIFCEALMNELDNAYQVLVIDHISMAIPGLIEDSSIWQNEIQNWLVALRSSGKAVILIHHSGKSGLQLGSSTKEFILDNTINIFTPPEYYGDETKFKTHFDKHRDVYGSAKADLQVTLVKNDEVKGEEYVSFEWEDPVNITKDRVRELYDKGMSSKDIAKTLLLDINYVVGITGGVYGRKNRNDNEYNGNDPGEMW